MRNSGAGQWCVRFLFLLDDPWRISFSLANVRFKKRALLVRMPVSCRVIGDWSVIGRGLVLAVLSAGLFGPPERQLFYSFERERKLLRRCADPSSIIHLPTRNKKKGGRSSLAPMHTCLSFPLPPSLPPLCIISCSL